MNKWARRTLMRAVQRLCALGVVKKVKARAREKEEIMQIRKKRTDRDVVPYVRCIRALRPITDRDRHLMVHPAVGIPQGPLGYENEEEEDWDNEDDEEDPGEEGLELDVNQDNLEAELLEDTGELEENGRLVPQWDPDVPLLDFVWNCVDASGPIGASSMVRLVYARARPYTDSKVEPARAWPWPFLAPSARQHSWSLNGRLGKISTSTPPAPGHYTRYCIYARQQVYPLHIPYLRKLRKGSKLGGDFMGSRQRPRDRGC